MSQLWIGRPSRRLWLFSLTQPVATASQQGLNVVRPPVAVIALEALGAVLPWTRQRLLLVRVTLTLLVVASYAILGPDGGATCAGDAVLESRVGHMAKLEGEPGFPWRISRSRGSPGSLLDDISLRFPLYWALDHAYQCDGSSWPHPAP